MHTPYVVARADRPWLALFIGSLEEVAAAWLAQPDASGLEITASERGFRRALDSAERASLAALGIADPS